MSKIKKDSLSDLVYRNIRQMMLNHDLEPGQRILKKELATVLGVSQTPVSEALNRFVKEGVIEQKARQGFFLKDFSPSDMSHFFEVRAGLESVALRRLIDIDHSCLKKLVTFFDEYSLPLNKDSELRYKLTDRKFHETILINSENPVIINFIDNFVFIVKCYQKGLIRPPSETLSEHHEIIEAIKERDAARAQTALMNHHLKSAQKLSES